LRTLPGIIDVAAASSAPLDGRYPPVAVRSRASERATRAGYDFVSSSFFRVLDIPILRGRNFSDEEERSEAPVAIVSDATARVLWPGRDPLGETLQLAVDTLAGRHSPLSSLRTVVVIGIAGNAVSGTMVTGLDEPVLYFPTGRDAAGRQLLARVAGTAAVARRAIDADLARVDPGAVEQIQTLDLYRAAQIYPFVATHWVSSALGVIALLLTLTGIYGVLSYVVAQRRKELGIRMALGATAGTIVGLVMRQALRLAMLGLGLGGALAVAVSSIFAANDFMLVVFDPVAYVGAGAMVLGACFAATYLPSRRAASVHPMEALRSD